MGVVTLDLTQGGVLPGEGKAQHDVTEVRGEIGEFRETAGDTRRRGTRHCVQRRARGQFKKVLKDRNHLSR